MSPLVLSGRHPTIVNLPLALPWILALAAAAVLTPLVGWLVWRGRRAPAPHPLPNEWTLTARPVFSTDERRVYRQLREALPHHIVLSKLPLVRFCQPNDPSEVRFWYELLGSIHVTFAVCSANGRVLAAIDLDTDRGNSQRVLKIKQSVLSACRVRYLRCPVDTLPSVAELQLLVPHAVAPRGPQPASAQPARPRAHSAPRDRTALWQDSSFFQDSFFAPDNRMDSSSSQFGTLSDAHAQRGGWTRDFRRVPFDHEPGGVVVDPPRNDGRAANAS